MRGIRRIAIATVLVTAGIGSAHLGAAGAVGNPWAPGTVFVASNGRTNGFDGSVEAIPPSGSPQDLYNGAPEDVAVDALGDVFMADCNAGSVYERPAAGGLVTFAAGLSCPDAVAVDGSGNVLVGDFYDLYRYAPGGGSRTTLLTGIPPQSIAVDGHGDVYVSDGSNELAVLVGGSAPLERVATSSLGLNPDAVRVDSAGDLYMANDFGNDAVELPVGSLTPTAFGTGLNYTDGVVVDGSGSVFISDVNGSRVAKVAGGSQTNALTGLDGPDGLAVSPPPSATSRTASSVVLGTTSPATVTTIAKVKLTATVSGSSPGGFVQFDNNGSALGNPVALVGGVAKLTTALPRGTDSVTAMYLGDAANYPSLSNALALTVNPIATKAVITTPAASVPQDQPLSVSATVTSTHGVPTGDIEFLVNGSFAGDGSVNGSGVATASVYLQPGVAKITAQYSGDAIFASSTSKAVTFHAVAPFSPGISATKHTGTKSGHKWPVTVTVTVTGVKHQPDPTGTVTVQEFACGALTPAATGVRATATCTASLGRGFYDETVSYGGDATYGPASTDIEFSLGGDGG